MVDVFDRVPGVFGFLHAAYICDVSHLRWTQTAQKYEDLLARLEYIVSLSQFCKGLSPLLVIGNILAEYDAVFYMWTHVDIELLKQFLSAGA